MKLFFGLWPYHIFRLCLGLYFVAAGTSKLTDIESFVSTIADFGIVFAGMELPTAVGLLVFEILVGLALILDLRGALAAIVGLLLLFVAILCYGTALGLDIDCGCLGPGRSLSLQGALVIDGCLLLACGYLYVSRHIRSSRPQTPAEFLMQFRKTT